MTELPTRTADPTLFAHSAEDGDVILTYRGDEPPVAHAIGVDHGPACGSKDADHWCESEHACWFAVPCREGCFDAPPKPGHRVGWGGWRENLDSGLAWQLPTTEERT